MPRVLNENKVNAIKADYGLNTWQALSSMNNRENLWNAFRVAQDFTGRSN